MQKKITSRDIAQLAGVHQSTVSRALNPETAWRISPRKREEIRNLCRKFGIMPTRSILKYSFERTRRIAWIFGAMERDLNGIGNSVFLRNMCDILQASGYILELIRLDYSPEKQEKNMRRILNSGMADVYIVGARLLNGQSLELLHRNSPRLILTLNEENSRIPYPNHHWLSYFIRSSSQAYSDAFEAIPPERRQDIFFFGRDNHSSQVKILMLQKLLKDHGEDPASLQSCLFGGKTGNPPEYACREAGKAVRENIDKLKKHTVFWCGGRSSCMLYDELLQIGKKPEKDFTFISCQDTGQLIPPTDPGIHLIARDMDLAAEKLCEQVFQLLDDPQPQKNVFHDKFQKYKFETN